MTQHKFAAISAIVSCQSTLPRIAANAIGMPAEKARPRIACGIASTRRSEEHTSELQSLMRISYAVFCLKKKNTHKTQQPHHCKNPMTKLRSKPHTTRYTRV